MGNKMGNTQKMAFLNAMKANKNKGQMESEESAIKPESEVTEKPYKTRAERHLNKSQEEVISTKQRIVTLDDLYDALAEVQDYKSKDYTPETWLPFVNAFTQALSVYQAKHPNMDDVVIAKEALSIAKKQLIRR